MIPLGSRSFGWAKVPLELPTITEQWDPRESLLVAKGLDVYAGCSSFSGCPEPLTCARPAWHCAWRFRGNGTAISPARGSAGQGPAPGVGGSHLVNHSGRQVSLAQRVHLLDDTLVAREE